jgi:hypothetical protein
MDLFFLQALIQKLSIVLKELYMRKDSKLVYVAEYLIGAGFLVAALPFIVHPQPGWSDAHNWASLVFMACVGITLISSASGTRQLINLSERIRKLEKELEKRKSAQNYTQHASGPQFVSKEHLVGSVN